MPPSDPSTALDDLLDFALIPAARGARGPKAKGAGAQPQVFYTRDLNAADVDLLLHPPAQGIGTPAVKSLRNSHHMLARLLAEGHKGAYISAITGYSASRISILQNDPSFKDLIAHYSTQVEEVFVDAQARLAALGIDTIEELHERLGDSPEQFSTKDLLAIAEMTMDRSVAPSKRLGTGASAPAAPQLPSIQINFVQSQVKDSAPAITLDAGPADTN